MKIFSTICIICISLFSQAQKNKNNFKIGVWGSAYRSDLFIKTSLKYNNSKYQPTWEPFHLLGGCGVSFSKLSNKKWQNSINLESRSYGFNYETGRARYRYFIASFSSGVKYKIIIAKIGTGIGKSYSKRFDFESSSKTHKSLNESYNLNKSIIIPFDFEIGISTDFTEMTFIVNSFYGELFKNLMVYENIRVYNYPYNIGVKFKFWIKK